MDRALPFEAVMISSNISEARRNGERTQQKIETALRVIVLAIPGFLILMFCDLGLIVEFLYGEPMMVDPFVGLGLASVSTLMILVGTGQWGRWAYSFVFLSIPTVGVIGTLLSRFLPEIHSDQNLIVTRLLGTAVFALPMIVSYVIVNAYYRRKAEKRAQTLSGNGDSHNGKPRN